MFSFRQFYTISKLFHSLRSPASQTRNYQVSVIGAASDIGSTVSMLLGQNPKVTALNLHDYDSKVWGIAKEISSLSFGPQVSGFDGDDGLELGIHKSHIILMLSNIKPDVVNVMSDVAYANSPIMYKLCKAISHTNPHAFLAIATDPINVMVPYAYQLLNKYVRFNSGYNPYQLFGVTSIDEVRAKNFAADFFNLNDNKIHVPVIGGHSSDTIVPLFSNIDAKLNNMSHQDTYQLTSMVRKCVPDAIDYKVKADMHPLSMAWSIYDFTDNILKALSGEVVEVQCYMANPQFGTRFFCAPVFIGPKGFIRSRNEFNMSPDERNILCEAIPRLNEDVAFASEMIRSNNYMRQ